MPEEEPCKDCINAAELADGTWICLQFSKYLADGSLYIQQIDDSVDWENCPFYESPTDEFDEEDNDDEDEDEEEDD